MMVVVSFTVAYLIPSLLVPILSTSVVAAFVWMVLVVMPCGPFDLFVVA